MVSFIYVFVKLLKAKNHANCVVFLNISKSINVDYKSNLIPCAKGNSSE